MKTLHLVLQSKWFDKVASGEKTSEYREIKPYWNKRFTGMSERYFQLLMGDGVSAPQKYATVVFHKGYTTTTMEFAIISIKTIINRPNDLGLDKCWEIKLGKRIK